MTNKHEPEVSIRILNPTSGMIMLLTEPQRFVLDLVVQGHAITGKWFASARAMRRNGWLEEKPERGTAFTFFVLTDAGRALSEEQALMKQTCADFTVGDKVEYLHWIPNNGKGWTHEWQPATVTKVTKAVVTFRRDGVDYDERHKPTTIRFVASSALIQETVDADFEEDDANGDITEASVDNVIAEQRAAFPPVASAPAVAPSAGSSSPVPKQGAKGWNQGKTPTAAVNPPPGFETVSNLASPAADRQWIVDYRATLTDPYLAVRTGAVASLLATMPKRWKDNSVLWEAYRALRHIRDDAQYAAFAQVTENSEREILKGRAKALPTEAEFVAALAKVDQERRS